MSDQYYRQNDDLAYGGDYSGNRGEGQQGAQDRGIIGDTFKKFKSKYDQYSNHGPTQQDPYGYGTNPSSSTVGSQQYGGGGGGGHDTSRVNQPHGQQQGQYGQSNQGQSGQYSQPAVGQSAYPGGPPQQAPQKKPGMADQMIGGLLGSITSIGSDVNKIIGGHGSRPQQGQQQYPGQQVGLQSNLQSHIGSGPTSNRYDSTFAGPKHGNDVKWYVDGCSYMWAVSQALENARQTIWIMDWWLSPELYLRRPPARNEEWRLDKVLQRAANRGVKVNVIVYKEVTQVLTLSSSHTKHALENLSPNIGVFRHPDHLPDAQTTHSSILSSLQGLKLDAAGASKLGADALKGIYGITDDVILYWAHHEKLCLVDGTTAFMGGLDLCYGRWDTNQHAIADAHPSDLNKIVFPGQDFNNARVMDFSEVNYPFQNKLDRTKSSRMGWSDISISLRGPCVGDLIHHFVDRWNLIYDEKYNVRQDKRYARLPPYPDHRNDEGPGRASATGTGLAQTQTQPGQQSAIPGQDSGHLSSQFNQGYTPPSWQGQHQQPATQSQPGIGSGLAGAAVGASVAAASSQPTGGQHDQYQQSQQGFPPPPPGPAPSQSQYGQTSTQSYQTGTPQTSSQYSQPQQPQTGYQPPSAAQQGTYTQQPHGYTDPQQATNYGQGGNQYQTGSQQQSYPTPTATPQPGQYGTQTQSSFPPPPTGATPGQYGGQSTAYAGQPQTQAGQGQSVQHPAQPLSQSGQGYNAPYQQSPVTSSSAQQAQVATSQYAAYTDPQPASQVAPPGSQGPVELGTAQSPHYEPYHGQPTARGLGEDDTYSGHGGERGFDPSNEYGGGYSGERGYHEGDSDRAFGRKPQKQSGGQSRFDKYKDEAKKFRQEGKIMGYDVSTLENKLDSKMSQYTGGRFGIPGSSAGGMNCQLVRSCTKWSNGTATEHSVQNAYIQLIQNSKHFIYIENQFFITATGDKQKPVKNLIGKAIVERIVRAAREQTPFKIVVVIPSVPAFAGDLVDDASLGTRAIMEFQYNSICRGGNSIMEEVQRAGVNPMDYIRFYNLRNYDRINITPSMQQAQQQTGVGYDDARRQYENQLGSGYAGYGEAAAPIPGSSQRGPEQQYGSQAGQYSFSPPPTQPIPSSTQQQGQTGQYGTPQTGYAAQPGGYNTNPTSPGYNQQPGQPSNVQQPGQAYNQYQQAAQAAPTVRADDWDSVSSCYMLGGQDIRTVPWSGPPEAELDAFVSEELYIHSKVMIVDDQTVVCGSANLNDRSMLGTHDSEIALIIQDQKLIQSSMAGRPWQASHFGATLRRQLFRKHLGLLRPQDYQRPDDNFMPVGVPNSYDWGTPEDMIVSDPLSDTFQSLWNSRARTNTDVFRRAFRAVPDDGVRNWSAYKEFFEYYFKRSDAQAAGKDQNQKQSRVEYGHVVAADFPGGAHELKELLSQVKGTLVEMPLCFLQDEDIAQENFSFNSLTSEIYT